MGGGARIRCIRLAVFEGYSTGRTRSTDASGPTVPAKAALERKVVREETFGPVVCAATSTTDRAR
jgi:acyl-CoA reductase-like NAD-dependent aldehyde dehydrogenase